MRFLVNQRVRPAIIALVGLLVMMWNLGTPSLWQDEAATIAAADRPLPSLFRLLGNIDAVHGTYYFFMRFWGEAFGFDPFALRVPSAIAVAVSAYLIYRLAIHLELGGQVATFAAVIFLALPRTFMSASEARSNAFTATLAIAVTLTLVMALRRKGWSAWFPYILVATLSLYMFLFSGLIFIAFGIYLALKRRVALKAFVIATATSLVLATPVIIYGYLERDQVGWIARKPIQEYLWESLVAVDYNRAWPMAILGLLLCLVAILRRVPLLLTLWATVPSVILVAVSLVGTPYFVDHYLSFTTGATALLIAYGICRALPNDSLLLAMLPNRPKSLALLPSFVVLILILMSLPSFAESREPQAKGSEWSGIAKTIQLSSQPGDAILLPDAVSRTSRALGLMVVAYEPLFVDRIDLTLKAKPADTDKIFGKRVPVAFVTEPGSYRVLVVSDMADGNAMLNKLPTWLTENFVQTNQMPFNTAKVTVFERK